MRNLYFGVTRAVLLNPVPTPGFSEVWGSAANGSLLKQATQTALFLVAAYHAMDHGKLLQKDSYLQDASDAHVVLPCIWCV